MQNFSALCGYTAAGLRVLEEFCANRYDTSKVTNTPARCLIISQKCSPLFWSYLRGNMLEFKSFRYSAFRAPLCGRPSYVQQDRQPCDRVLQLISTRSSKLTLQARHIQSQKILSLLFVRRVACRTLDTNRLHRLHLHTLQPRRIYQCSTAATHSTTSAAQYF